MKVKSGKIITLVMLIISSLITLAMLALELYAVFFIRFFFPIIFFALFVTFWIWIDIHFLNCYRYLKNGIMAKRQTTAKLIGVCTALIVLTSFCSISMLLVAIGSTIVLGGVFLWIQLYCLAFSVVSGAYAVGILPTLLAVVRYKKDPN